MRRLAIVAAALLLSTSMAEAQPVDGSMGEVSFANSGAPAAQRAFHRALALMHNFQFPAAAEAFREAQKADPGFVMAYWGEAMTHNHAIWMEQDAGEGRAVLAKLASDRAARLARARTERERALLDAVETLYGEGDKEARDFAYSAKMERAHLSHPEDVDIASLYALSLLGLAHDGRDYRLYMRAAGILEEYFPRYQRHPGVVHYLIHSYDDPTHAPLGLRTARLYGAIAKDSHHAQHMTSHIFIALGDWPSTIKANEAAIAVVNRDRQAAGKPAAACGHYPEWLHYAHYQAGHRAQADAMLAACHETAAKELADKTPGNKWALTRSYAGMWTRSIAETGRAPQAPRLALSREQNPVERLIADYGALLLARGKPSALAAARRELKASTSAARKAAKDYVLFPTIAQILELQGQGLEDIAAGKRASGLEALRKAARLEASMPVEFGPPVIEKPSYELLAEELVAAGRREEAADAFRQALKLAPGRTLSVTQLAKIDTGGPNSVSTAAAAPHKH